MATGKRYYWIKLKSSFLTSDAVDFLMGQPDGANYVVLYQMICLKTINTGGRLQRQIGEILIPYDEAKIQRDCKWFSIDTVRVALNLYKALGLIYDDQDGILCLTGYDDLVGSETDWAAKKRRQANRESSPQLPPADGEVSGESGGENFPIEIEYRDKSIESRDRDQSVDSAEHNKKGNKKEKKFSEDSKPYLLAVFLGKRIHTRLPSTEFPSEDRLQQWADAIDKCNRIDGHPWDEIKYVLKFSQDDPFWQANILSGRRFREKYIELLAKMTAHQQGRKPAQGASTVDRLLDMAQRGVFDDEPK